MVEQHAFYADRVDFKKLRHLANVTSSTRGPQGMYSIALAALDELGDRHSHFFNPEEAKSFDQEFDDPTPKEVPTAKALDDGVGYLVVPSVEAFLPSPSGDAYTAATRDSLRQLDVCGWVVDLRANSGGSVDPMLQVVAPLLGPGTFVGYRDRAGALESLEINADLNVVHHDPTFVVTPPTAALSPAPGSVAAQAVAVLVGRNTASAAEAIAIAFEGRPRTRFFGEPTAGIPTGNELYPLSDGSALLLTTAIGVDRTGATYESQMQPDELIVQSTSNNAATPRENDETALAARAWLHTQPQCD